MRPQWHYRPEKNWINDPNGLVHYKGWYHLFYQYNPHGDEWGDMHWGHARSRDLLNWETLSIAMAPALEKGELHCFSGSCCKDGEGRPHFFYTSIGDEREGRGGYDGAQQWMAEPVDDDLTALVQSDELALTADIHGNLNVLDWRDPCVFRHKGQYLMALCGTVEGKGCTLLYTSPDLKKWTFHHILAMSNKADKAAWECPNLFPIGDKFALIYSPYAAPRIKLGTLDDGLNFHEEREDVLDPGHVNGFYAPQVFKDEAGRVLLMGWMPECDNVPHKGWSGVMSLPRVLTLDADGVHAAPIPGAENLPGVRTCTVDRADLPMTWTIHRAPDGSEETLLTLSADGTLTLDRSRSTLAESPSKTPITRTVPLREVNEVFISVDASAVECAVNGRWLSGRIYPTKA